MVNKKVIKWKEYQVTFTIKARSIKELFNKINKSPVTKFRKDYPIDIKEI